MNKTTWIHPFLLFALLTPPFASSQEKQADGVLFRLTQEKETDPRWMKIQVCSDDIIRVIASREQSPSTRPSLMVDKTSWEPVHWSVHEKDGQTVITTTELSIQVDAKSGSVAFLDAAGKLLLKEHAGGGKIFTAADVMGEKTWHI